MESFWTLADKYLILGGTHPGITVIDLFVLGCVAVWFLILLRLYYLTIKNLKDARYMRNEMIYATALLAPIWITSKLQLIPFLFVNLLLYCLMVWAAKSEKKAISHNEQIGITSHRRKDWDLQASEFHRMIPEEKAEYFQKLAEHQSKMGWHAEVKLLTLTLLYWLPALTASVFAHLYYM